MNKMMGLKEELRPIVKAVMTRRVSRRLDENLRSRQGIYEKREVFAEPVSAKFRRYFNNDKEWVRSCS
jgi:hypothetical protein